MGINFFATGIVVSATAFSKAGAKVRGGTIRAAADFGGESRSHGKPGAGLPAVALKNKI